MSVLIVIEVIHLTGSVILICSGIDWDAKKLLKRSAFPDMLIAILLDEKIGGIVQILTSDKNEFKIDE